MKEVTIDYERLKGAVTGARLGVKLADHLGIHKGSLSRKLNSSIPIPLEELNKISQFLGRDTMDFLMECNIDNGRHAENGQQR